jgi:hypothetical protein
MKEGFANVVFALHILPDGMKSPRNGGYEGFSVWASNRKDGQDASEFQYAQ